MPWRSKFSTTLNNNIKLHSSKVLFWLKTDINFWDFPGNPVVKTLPPNAWGVSLVPGQAARIPFANPTILLPF